MVSYGVGVEDAVEMYFLLRTQVLVGIFRIRTAPNSLPRIPEEPLRNTFPPWVVDKIPDAGPTTELVVN